MEKEGKKSNKDSKKIVIKDKKRFVIALAIIALALLIVILIFANKKQDIANVDDYSNLNAKKYSNELFEKYNTEESKNKFLDDYDFIQGAIGIYIMNNSTYSPDSFTNIIKDLRLELSQKTWTKLDYERPTFWNGEFSVDDKGILNFKFSSKSIEPSWINDEELEGKIILN